MGDRDNYRGKSNDTGLPRDQRQVREDFPEERDLLNWVPWDGEQ